MIRITLRSKKDQAVRRYHPWIFSNAIKDMTGDPEEGEVVAVYSNKQKLLGCGHYQREGSISIRMLVFGEELYTEDLLTKRVQDAWQTRLRSGLLREDNNVFRLIYAEGDRLPGLIADFYGGLVVMQCHSSGMWLSRHQIAEELMGIAEVNAVYSRSASYLSRFPSLNAQDEILAGTPSDEHIAVENGHRFLIDWQHGQKTGFFIDQRNNRDLLGKYSQGKKVLNTFCYTGGFSVYALAQGAELVHSLDSSQPALDLVDKNLELNGLSTQNHKNICADAVDYMKNLGEDYDIIVLDPPAFAKSRHNRHNAVQGYKRLNAAAIRQIKRGGLIFTFSCSQVVDSQLFKDTIVAAGLAAEREVRILERLSQPADHPTSLYHPEGEYLKGLIIQVD